MVERTDYIAHLVTPQHRTTRTIRPAKEDRERSKEL